MSKQKFTRDNREAGAAILEFALAMPLLVLSISGLIYVAESFGELISLSQVAYNTALSGSEQSAAVAQDVMNSRIDFLTKDSNHLRGKFLAGAAQAVTSVTNGVYDTQTNQAVTAKLSVTTRNILNIIGLSPTLGQSIVSPILYNATEGASQDYNSYKNAPQKYDCDGNISNDFATSCDPNRTSSPAPFSSVEVGDGETSEGGGGGGNSSNGGSPYLTFVDDLTQEEIGGSGAAQEETPPSEGCYKLTLSSNWICPAI